MGTIQGTVEWGVLFSELGERITDNTDVFGSLWLKDSMFSVMWEARSSGEARTIEASSRGIHRGWRREINSSGPVLLGQLVESNGKWQIQWTEKKEAVCMKNETS